MNDDINAILAAYTDAAARPGGTRLEEWVRRYPQHERALVRFAVYRHVVGSRDARVQDDPEAEALFLARAQAIREQMMTQQRRAGLTGLLDAAKAQGLSAATLARELKLGLPVVAKLDRRLLRAAGLPKRLLADLARLLHRPLADIAAYLRQPPTLSAQASYKADQAPRVAAQEEFASALDASRDMTDEQKAFWRAELNDVLGDTE